MTETQMVQPPTQFGEYNFPSRDRIEEYGDDQIVNVFWEDNIFVATPGCFRVPRNMPWNVFQQNVFLPWAAMDPDFDAAKVSDWRSDDAPIQPKDEDTFETLGVPHKGLLKFRCG